MKNLDAKAVQDEITALLLAYPELFDDEVLREDMIEGQTSTFEFLSGIVRKIGSTKALAGGTADYIGELQERKARLERREHALRSLISKVMHTADLRKAELPEATISPRAVQPAHGEVVTIDWFRIYLMTMTTLEMIAVWIIALCLLFR